MITELLFALWHLLVFSPQLPFPGPGMVHVTAGGGGNLVTYIQSKKVNLFSSSSGAVMTLDSTSGSGSGRFMIGVWAADTAATSFTDSASNTYTSRLAASDSGTFLSIWTAPLSSAATTVTCNPSGTPTFRTCYALEYSGVNATPFDVNGSTPIVASPFDCGALTTTNANDVIISGLALGVTASGTIGAGTGFTLRIVEETANSDGGILGGVQDKNLTSTQTITPQMTSTASFVGICGSVALKSQ